MKFSERVKNIFEPNSLPHGFVHNPEFDKVFLYQTFGRVPAIVWARNGRKYMYFEDMTADKLKIVRKMGFRPHRHKSKRYNPAKVIYRAPISILMQQSAWHVVTKIELDNTSNVFGIAKSVDTFKQNEQYLQYISAYVPKTR